MVILEFDLIGEATKNPLALAVLIITTIPAIIAAIASLKNKKDIEETKRDVRETNLTVHKNKPEVEREEIIATLLIVESTVTDLSTKVDGMEKVLDDVKRKTSKDEYIIEIMDYIEGESVRLQEIKKNDCDADIKNFLGIFAEYIKVVVEYIVKTDLLYKDRKVLNVEEFRTKVFALSTRYIVNNKEAPLPEPIFKIYKEVSKEAGFSLFILELQNIRRGEYGSNGLRIEKFKEILNTHTNGIMYNLIKDYAKYKKGE